MLSKELQLAVKNTIDTINDDDSEIATIICNLQDVIAALEKNKEGRVKYQQLVWVGNEFKPNPDSMHFCEYLFGHKGPIWNTERSRLCNTRYRVTIEVA